MSDRPSALDLLREHPLLRLASAEGLESLAAAANVRDYDAGAVVALAGSRQTQVLALVRGRLVLHRRNREAKTQLLAGVAAAPVVFGDAEAYSQDGRWNVTARAAEPTCIVQLPNAAYDAFCRREPEFATAMYRDACSRLYLANEIMQVHGLQRTRHKIVRLLQSQPSRPGPAPNSRQTNLNQNDLASALGVTRKTVSRCLSELERDGVLQRVGSSSVVFREQAEFKPLSAGTGCRWSL